MNRTQFHIVTSASVAVFATTLLSGCPDPSASLLVTINARPAVIRTDSLKVRIASEGVGQDRVFDVTNKTFPLTFSVTTTSLNANDVQISVESFVGGTPNGTGKVAANFAAGTTQLTLEPLDFVVNDRVLGDQRNVDDIEAVGYQITSFDDGRWDVGFRTPDESNPGTFQLQGRRFDHTTAASNTPAAGNDHAWNFTTTSAGFTASLAMANNNQRSIATWDSASATLPADNGIMCRSIGTDGALNSQPVKIANDVEPDVVAMTTLSTGKFFIVWKGSGPTAPGTPGIRGMVADQNCLPVVGGGSGAFPVSTPSAALVTRASIASRSNSILVGWRSDSNIVLRRFDAAGVPSGPDKILLLPEAAPADYVRLAPLADGFAAVVAQTMPGGTDIYRLTLIRLSVSGDKFGAPTVITENTHAPNAYGFAVHSTGGNDPLVVSWRSCPANGGSQCGDIVARVIRPNGQPVGPEFAVSTTNLGTQDSPSVARINPITEEPAYVFTWSDESQTAPDTSMHAVRARVMYPPYNQAAGILGAECRTGQTLCDPGLACVGSSDGSPRCTVACNPTGAIPLCPSGGTCTIQGTVSGCIF
jgi:hypothetical protein